MVASNSVYFLQSKSDFISSRVHLISVAFIYFFVYVFMYVVSFSSYSLMVIRFIIMMIHFIPVFFSYLTEAMFS